jgi:hypothetical protein
MQKDQQGCLIVIKCNIQGSPSQLINIYARNTTSARLKLFTNLHISMNRSDKTDMPFSANTILGDDYNIILNANLDRKGGTGIFSSENMKTIQSLHKIQDEFDQCDEWRMETKKNTNF